MATYYGGQLGQDRIGSQNLEDMAPEGPLKGTSDMTNRPQLGNPPALQLGVNMAQEDGRNRQVAEIEGVDYHNRANHDPYRQCRSQWTYACY